MATSKEHHTTQRLLLADDGTLTLPQNFFGAFNGARALRFVSFGDGHSELQPPDHEPRNVGAQVLALHDGTFTLPLGHRLDPEMSRIFDALLRPDGVIELRLVEECDPDQAWFWSEEWQRGERAIDEDIAAGRIMHFDSAEECIAYLENPER